MLREVGEDETIIKWEDYKRLIRKAFMFDRMKEWTAKEEYELDYKKMFIKEEANESV